MTDLLLIALNGYGARFNIPLLVASSSNWVSTTAPGRWTYLTTLPLMNTFLTDDYHHTTSAYVLCVKLQAHRCYVRFPIDCAWILPTCGCIVRRGLHAYKMRVFDFLHHTDIVKLDVEVLID
jgi:hypothetical protein